MQKIKIGNKLIGENEPVFVIAEAGVNHNGSLKIAKKLIKIASKANADAVKFQTFSADNLVTKNAPKADYQKITTNINETQYEMLKKLELTKKDHKKLIEYANKLNIIFLSTPYDIESVNLLQELKVLALKVSSGNLTNIPLIKHMAKTKLPMIVSTGMATLNEIKEAIQVIKKMNNTNIILLHCTSNYPTKITDVNLRTMQTLKHTFNLPIGYSDHTKGILVPILATALGATVIEKHFTLDKNLPGPDHKASLEPHELKKMIDNIRNTEKILGKEIKKPTKSEMEISNILRTSIVAKIDIPKETIITEKMLTVKRPGIGLPPKYIDKIINKKTKKNIKKDELIKWNLIY
jgi:N-acetylneuraminate synthase/N,N'-diacetyllegionaminate synthase